MNLVRIQKRYLLITAILIVVVMLFILSILLSRQFSPQTQQPVLPTPTPYPGTENIEQSATYKESVKRINAEQQETLSKSEKVGNLLLKLPYFGNYFAMRYNYATNQYIVVINNQFRSQGETEFDAFLQSNGIENRSWITQLDIRYR